VCALSHAPEGSNCAFLCVHMPHATQAAAQTFPAADEANKDIDPFIKAVVCCNVNCQGAEGTAEERRCVERVV